jgi:pimeloyl-ACP methyl ester carboxylesterase
MSAPGAPSRRRRRIVLGVTGFVVGLVVLAAGSFVLRPFFWLERLGKARLRWDGLRRAQVQGPRGRVVYRQGGTGPVLVLVHGANDQCGAWALVAGRLAASRRLVLPDLPGHGDSDPRDGPLGIGDLLAGVEAVIEAAAPGARLSLVGNSLGGYLALLYAERHPGRVDRVVLLNGAAIRAQPGVAVSLLPRTREEARATMDALTAPESPRVPAFILDDLVRRGPTSPLARLLAIPIEDRYVLDERLSGMATPVSLLWGEADRYMPVSYAETVRARLPSARLEVLPGCGHVPQRECPDRLLPALERALAP